MLRLCVLMVAAGCWGFLTTFMDAPYHQAMEKSVFLSGPGLAVLILVGLLLLSLIVQKRYLEATGSVLLACSYIGASILTVNLLT